MVPPYGSRIKLINILMDQWSLEVFKEKKIGDACGGFKETGNKMLSRMDMTEASIKVKGNCLASFLHVLPSPS